jgi:hypothetical protein
MDYTQDVITCGTASVTKTTQSGMALAYTRGTPGGTNSRQPTPVVRGPGRVVCLEGLLQAGTGKRQAKDWVAFASRV